MLHCLAGSMSCDLGLCANIQAVLSFGEAGGVNASVEVRGQAVTCQVHSTPISPKHEHWMM